MYVVFISSNIYFLSRELKQEKIRRCDHRVDSTGISIEVEWSRRESDKTEIRIARMRTPLRFFAQAFLVEYCLPTSFSYRTLASEDPRKSST